MPENENNNQTAAYPGEGFGDMIEAGVFYGRKKSKINPKMRSFILAVRDGVGIINLEKTSEELASALDFLKGVVKNGGLAFVVGTQPSAQDGVLKLAAKFGLPFVVNRWVGGTLTNLKVVGKRVEYLKKLRSDLKSGALEKYTKKERVTIEGEIKRLENLMGGLENLNREPNVLIVIDPNVHATAVRESRRMKIPVLALTNLDADPDLVDYPVLGNNKSRKSIDWFLAKIESAIGEGLRSRLTAEEKTEIKIAASENETKKRAAKNREGGIDG